MNGTEEETLINKAERMSTIWTHLKQVSNQCNLFYYLTFSVYNDLTPSFMLLFDASSSLLLSGSGSVVLLNYTPSQL